MAIELTKEIFNREILKASDVCVLGHVNPDGDSIGSVLGVYNYILSLKGRDFKDVAVYLDDPPDKFGYLRGFDLIRSRKDERKYSLAIICDCADIGRMGKFSAYFKDAGTALLVDHHVTNPGFGDYALIDGEASSASELVYGLMDDKYFDKYVAECIYTGIVHDTGVFRYASTSRRTMEIAGKCIGLGISFSSIIEDTYFNMTPEQKRILGYLLYNMKSRFEGRMVYSCIDMETRRALGSEDTDLDGMIDSIRTTTGADMALFLYETREGAVKASLRSNSDDVDVSLMAVKFGGGGHKRAAGCFMSADFDKDIDEISGLLSEQFSKKP